MTGPLIGDDREAAVVPRNRPHLSHSQIQKYLDCPEKYRLYYIEGLRPRYPSANLVFGQIVHQALAHLFQTGEDPVQPFIDRWDEARTLELTYQPAHEA